MSSARSVVVVRFGQGVTPAPARTVHQSRPMELSGIVLRGVEDRSRSLSLIDESGAGRGLRASTWARVTDCNGTPCKAVPCKIASQPPMEDRGMLLRGIELSGVPATPMLLNGM